MTKEKLVEQLKICASMGDKQIETLANILVDYFSASDKQMGFTDKKDKNAEV